jgi:Tfp pilus assembly protein PilO
MSPRWRRRALFALAGGAALNLAVYFAYTLPRTLGEQRIAERQKLLQDEILRERLAVAYQRRQADTIKANTVDMQRFYATTVSARAASLVPVLRAIEGMAREGGMRPGAASYKAEDVKGMPLDRFAITMPVTGTYRQLVAFVQRLEQSQYFLTLDKVIFRDMGEGSRAELAMVLSCYFRAGEGEP